MVANDATQGEHPEPFWERDSIVVFHKRDIPEDFNFGAWLYAQRREAAAHGRLLVTLSGNPSDPNDAAPVRVQAYTPGFQKRPGATETTGGTRKDPGSQKRPGVAEKASGTQKRPGRPRKDPEPPKPTLEERIKDARTQAAETVGEFWKTCVVRTEDWKQVLRQRELYDAYIEAVFASNLGWKWVTYILFGKLSRALRPDVLWHDGADGMEIRGYILKPPPVQPTLPQEDEDTMELERPLINE